MTEETESATATEEVIQAAELVTNEVIKTAPKSLPEDQEWNKVELNPEQQKRFNRIYAQLKSQDTIQAEIIKQNRQLMDKLEQYETTGKTVEHKTELEKLKAVRRTMLMEGRLEEADQLDEQIYELRQAKPKAKEPTVDQPVQLDPAIQNKVVSWANAVDADGEMLRPFMLPGHPKNKAALVLIESVLRDDALYGRDIDEYVIAIDKALESAGYMKTKTKTGFSPVLESSGQPRASRGKTSLSMEEIAVAKKMYRDDPDPIARYMKAKERLK